MEGTPKPVVVALSGGLGNQMFQYATGRALAVKLGSNLELDLSWFDCREDRSFALLPFKIVAKTRVLWPGWPERIRSPGSRLLRRYSNRLMNLPIFREPHFHYAPAFAMLDHPVFLEGYWQSERYFDSIRDTLLNDFSLKEAPPEACQRALAELQDCDAICVHVRRGDYLSPANAQTHGTCPVDYYQRGVAELVQGLARPHCFIFSDDPAWARASLEFPCRTTVMDINGPRDAHLDLYLMSLCKRFLIANSSLSWWGAWLGTTPCKQVIAPAQWFRDQSKRTDDLIPDMWKRI